MPDNDIRSVKQRHSADMLRTPGVSGFGVERDDAGNEVLVVHVATSDPGVAAGLPREIEGYPVRIVESGPYRALDG